MKYSSNCSACDHSFGFDCGLHFACIGLDFNIGMHLITQYIYVCVVLCVCVRERERERVCVRGRESVCDRVFVSVRCIAPVVHSIGISHTDTARRIK